jgi:hypothetical protein
VRIRALGIGICALAVLAGPGTARPAQRVRLPSDCLRRSTEPGVAKCLRPTFQSAAATGRVGATLDALDEAVQRGRLDDCHALAHELAHVVVARVRRVDRALALGGSQCSDGYQHGVVEAAAGVGAGPSTCARRRSEELRDACHHALGHRYLIATRYDVRAALARCRERLRGEPAERCTDGVMMQNSMQFMRLGAALYALHAPHACDGLHLHGRLRATCYEEIGEVAMFVFRHRLPGARRVCARVATAYGRRACNAGARAELELSRSA